LFTSSKFKLIEEANKIIARKSIIITFSNHAKYEWHVWLRGKCLKISLFQKGISPSNFNIVILLIFAILINCASLGSLLVKTCVTHQ